MKPIKHYVTSALTGMGILAVFLFTFSCSTDPVPETENLEVINARSNNAVLKTLVKGAALKAANGLDVGPDGNLYVASVNGQEIVAMNTNSGKIIRRYGADTGVFGPDDMVFGPDGTFYWTDILTGFVGRKSIDGTTLKYGEVFPGVNPIRFSDPNPDDPESKPRLFVGLDFLGDGIYELDPVTLEPTPFIICPEGFGLGFFNSFDTRWEDGRLWLYGPLFALNVVVAIDIDAFAGGTVFPGDLTGLFASLGNGSIRIVAGNLANSDLFNPAAAKFGPDGMLYVLDQAGKVWKANPDGEDDKTLFTTLDPGLDNMTFDEDGTLYMTNNDEGWVAEILPNGQPRYLSRGGMILPQGLAVMPGSNNQDMVFEADLFRLRRFDGTSGRQEDLYKGFLINPTLDLPILPMNISAAGDKLVVSSWFSGAVQLWDLTTNPATVVPGYTFAMPVPIDAVLFNGDMIVSDFGLGGVVNASNNNTMIQRLGAASGLATDGEKLWAADQESGEIWEITFDPPGARVITDDMEGPEGLALDNEGRLLVVEAKAFRLSRIDDLTTGDKTVLAEGLALFGPGLGSPPTWGFDGVAVGAKGDIYISGAGATVLHKISANKVR